MQAVSPIAQDTMYNQGWGHQTTHSREPYGGVPRDGTQNQTRRASLATAASYMQGPLREELLRQASVSTSAHHASVKERELDNLRRWSLNPSDLKLREIGPVSIVKNIFGLKDLINPTAEVFYTIMALWRYCPDDCKDAV